MIHRITRIPFASWPAGRRALARGLRRGIEVRRQLEAGPVRRRRSADEAGLQRRRGADAAFAPVARQRGHEGTGRLHRRHPGLQGRHAGHALPDRRRPLRREPRPRTSCTSPAWAWTPAAAGARRWWGHGRRVRERGEGQSFTGFAGHCWVTQWKAPESPDQVGAVDPDDLAGSGRAPAACAGPPRRGRDRRSAGAPGRWRCRSWRSSPAAAGPRDTRARGIGSVTTRSGRPSWSVMPRSRSRFSCSGS